MLRSNPGFSGSPITDNDDGLRADAEPSVGISPPIVSWRVRGARLHHYYVSQSVLKQGARACPIGRVPAGEIETAVIGLLRAPEVIIGTWRPARPEISGLTEAEVRDAPEGLDPLWDELFPAEQARIVHLLVERVDVGADGIAIRPRTAGLASVAADLRAAQPAIREAA